MKRHIIISAFAAASVMVLGLLCASPATAQVPYNQSTEGYVNPNPGNPYLPLWEHLPDGEPRVFEDPDNPGKYRAYIIGSHDVRTSSYCGPDIRAWSAPVEDLTAWRDEGPIFTYPISGQWDVMYAPDLVEIRKKDGTKEYYLYPHSRGRNREPMVCKGSRPDGPFTPINMTEDGTSTVPGSIMGFDPSVFVEYITDPSDPDYEIGFRAYGFWGFQRSMAAELDQNTMYSVRPGTEMIPYFMPASARYGVVRDPAGTKYSALYEGEDPRNYNFFEASSIRQVGNKFVWVYSGYSGPEYGQTSTNSALRYAYADSPMGPWKSGGVLVDSRGIVTSEDKNSLITGFSGHNTHGSLQLINDQWYVFYHRAPRGFGNARQATVAPVTIQWDEKSVDDGGKVVIRAYDPYAPDGIWTAKDNNGHEYTGAEVTSEGFHIFGLDPYQYISAGYACFLSDLRSIQDTYDIWNNQMDVYMNDGDIVGFKYFGFGGLKEATKGLKPFEGTKKGNNTEFDVFLTPKSMNSFKIAVMMDSPWASHGGVKIGEITVPASAAKRAMKFSVNVADYVDGLDGKHAIYLVADGSGELCTLHGIGFSSKKKSTKMPVSPKVVIKVDGKDLDIPVKPIPSTNANGYINTNTYEVFADVASGTISAFSDNPNVKINVEQTSTLEKTGVVTCDLNGLVKTFLVRFK